MHNNIKNIQITYFDIEIRQLLFYIVNSVYIRAKSPQCLGTM